MKTSLRKAINGILLVNKPQQLSSNQVLQKIKRKLNAAKAGHAGTLDPLATGMLLMCFGRATKLVDHMLNADKSYTATIQLGQATTTGDSEGEVIETRSIPAVDATQLAALQEQFLGEQVQTPPMYSALKHQGKPLYEYARQGIEIERPSRKITVKSLHIDPLTQQDQLTFQVCCSKGTYVRTLAEDMAAALGTVGHLVALHRDYCAGFETSDMLPWEVCESAAPESLKDAMLPMDAGLSSWPIHSITRGEWEALCQGKVLLLPSHLVGWVRLYCDENVVAIAEVLDGRILSRKLVQVL